MLHGAMNKLFGDAAWTDTEEEDFSDTVLSDLFPYRVYDPKTGYFYNEASTGFIFEVQPVVGGGDIPGAVQAALAANCPMNGTFQVINWCSPEIVRPLNAWVGARKCRGNLIVELANNRRDHLLGLRYGSETLVKCIPHSRRIFVLGWIDGQAGLSQE